MEVFISWSGGKDSCYAAYLAATSGLEISCLVHLVNEKPCQSWPHHLSEGIIRLQAKSLGIPLVQYKSTPASYEAKFCKALKELRSDGINGGIFGDIDSPGHRAWIEKVCAESGIEPFLPLWKMSQKKILKSFIAAGFEAVVVGTEAAVLGKERLGRVIDSKFIRDIRNLRKTDRVTFCGESGEFHTLVIDGPTFSRRIEIGKTKKLFHDGYWFLEIPEPRLISKQKACPLPA